MIDQPIRILQLCEHFGNNSSSFHGVARSFELWLPHLNEAPFQTLLCSRAQPNQAALDRYRAIGIEPLSLGYHKLDPRNLLRLIGILRRERIDIMHVHGYGASTWGRIAGHLLRIPVIVHERCNYHTVPWFQRPVELALGPFTRYAFAVSESTRVFTVKKRYIPDANVRLLYSGIDLRDVPMGDAAASQRLRASYGLGANDFLFGVVSRLEPHKGHRDLFKAFAAVHAEHHNTYLWVLGDGYDQDALRGEVEALGLENVVTFLGYQRDVWPFVYALDVQVFPSHREGTPNTLYEAMAAGKAMVASTADGQGEILRHERDALTYAPGDVDGLRQQLLRLYDDAALRASLAHAARQRVEDFDMRKTIETIRQTYLMIMDKEA
jgi:glycosyltransferase involved in cell wall biosynthesis